jgi:hypothetical protein
MAGSLSNSPQRTYGVAITTFLGMLAWVSWQALGWPWLSGGLVGTACVHAVVFYLVPSSRVRLIALFQAITFPIRWAATLVVMGIVYYGVLTPIAIWFRATGKSIRTDAPDASSNWHPIDVPSDPDSYFRTF